MLVLLILSVDSCALKNTFTVQHFRDFNKNFILKNFFNIRVCKQPSLHTKIRRNNFNRKLHNVILKNFCKPTRVVNIFYTEQLNFKPFFKIKNTFIKIQQSRITCILDNVFVLKHLFFFNAFSAMVSNTTLNSCTVFVKNFDVTSFILGVYSCDNQTYERYYGVIELINQVLLTRTTINTVHVLQLIQKHFNFFFDDILLQGTLDYVPNLPENEYTFGLNNVFFEKFLYTECAVLLKQPKMFLEYFAVGVNYIQDTYEFLEKKIHDDILRELTNARVQYGFNTFLKTRYSTLNSLFDINAFSGFLCELQIFIFGIQLIRMYSCFDKYQQYYTAELLFLTKARTFKPNLVIEESCLKKYFYSSYDLDFFADLRHVFINHFKSVYANTGAGLFTDYANITHTKIDLFKLTQYFYQTCADSSIITSALPLQAYFTKMQRCDYEYHRHLQNYNHSFKILLDVKKLFITYFVLDTNSIFDVMCEGCFITKSFIKLFTKKHHYSAFFQLQTWNATTQLQNCKNPYTLKNFSILNTSCKLNKSIKVFNTHNFKSFLYKISRFKKRFSAKTLTNYFAVSYYKCFTKLLNKQHSNKKCWYQQNSFIRKYRLYYFKTSNNFFNLCAATQHLKICYNIYSKDTFLNFFCETTQYAASYIDTYHTFNNFLHTNAYRTHDELFHYLLVNNMFFNVFVIIFQNVHILKGRGDQHAIDFNTSLRNCELLLWFFYVIGQSIDTHEARIVFEFYRDNDRFQKENSHFYTQVLLLLKKYNYGDVVKRTVQNVLSGATKLKYNSKVLLKRKLSHIWRCECKYLLHRDKAKWIGDKLFLYKKRSVGMTRERRLGRYKWFKPEEHSRIKFKIAKRLLKKRDLRKILVDRVFFLLTFEQETLFENINIKMLLSGNSVWSYSLFLINKLL